MKAPKPYINWFAEQSKLHDGHAAILTKEISITYKQLSGLVNDRVEGLQKINIMQNDIVGVLAEHSYQFIIDLLAIWRIGAAAFPINVKLTEEEINRQVNFIGCKVLTEDKAVNKSIADCSAALIMFTSGSTGENKAVVHSLNSLFASVSSIDQEIHLEENKKWLASLPFYRIGGFQIIIRSLLTGGTLCIPSGISTENIINGIIHFKPDYISLVNATYRSLLQSSINGLKNTKAIFIGGGPVESSLFKEGLSKGLPVYKVYGSTETGSMITMLKPEDVENKIDSAGKPLPGVKLKIEQNEILVSTNSLFTGYYKNCSLTKEKIVNGWYRTGDIGFIDNDGFLFVEGRKDNILISGGEKINPTEIEDILKYHFNITDAVVLGIPDEKWGQKVCAAVVCNINLNISEVQDKLKQILPIYKIPKIIKQVESIRVDEMGKVNLTDLQNLFS